MRITQGTFSFLPDLTDEQIAAQLRYALRNGWAIMVEHTDDPHPRNGLWEMWDAPQFDLHEDDADLALGEVRAAREAHPHDYVKVVCYDRSLGRQSSRAVVHRRPAGGRAGLPALAPGRPGPAHPLHDRARMTVAAARTSDETRVRELLAGLDDELVALAPVKRRIREIAALLVVERLREEAGLQTTRPSLHMSFTGSPGTGKTTVALKMAEILHGLGYIERPRVVSVTRDDLVGQYVGHTAPKTKEVLKRAYGGVLFIDEAYFLHRPENERDYGQEAVEILLGVMEAERDRLVVVLAGYRDRMEAFFRANPGMGSRVAPPRRLPRLQRRGADGDRFADARALRVRADRRRAGRVARPTSSAAWRSRASPTRAASATRSIARGCARPTGCSRATAS